MKKVEKYLELVRDAVRSFEENTPTEDVYWYGAHDGALCELRRTLKALEEKSTFIGIVKLGASERNLAESGIPWESCGEKYYDAQMFWKKHFLPRPTAAKIYDVELTPEEEAETDSKK